MRRPRLISAALLVAAALSAACASSKDPSLGRRVLEAVVVGREHEAPGEGSASFRGTGNYYLVFEAREGDATARYRYPVSHQNYMRYPEGSRVQITLDGHDLRSIRPLP
jgi:hypothetical protein